MSATTYSAPIALLLRLNGWRLRALITAVTVLAAVLIVSVMSLLLQGRITGDYLLTGLVTAALVAPLSLALLNQLVDLLAKQHEELLAGRLAETERCLNQALIESHGLLQAIVDTAPIRVFWKDRSLRYLGCNPVFARDAGKSGPREVIGGDDYQMGWAEQAESYRADDRSVMDSGIAKLSYEETQTTPDGQKIWLRTSKVPLRNEDGQTIGILGIYDDITDRKQAEAELAQHRQRLEELVARRTEALLDTEARASLILDSSADGLYGIDRRGIVTFMNPAAGAMLGHQPGQVIGKEAHALFHHSRPDGSPYPAGECPGHGPLCSGEVTRVDDEVYWRADGRPLPVMYAVHPMVKAGEVIGAVISFVDMSEQRAAARARDEAVLAAETLAHSRREFLANMSHEIRTPLNGVLGFAQIGLKNYRDGEKARHAFEKILASGNLLLGVINDILDFSKIEAGKLDVERTAVDLGEVMRQTVDIVRDRALAKHLELRVELDPELPPACLGDSLRMRQVLLNLLSNAVKFTERGAVSLSVRQRDGRLVFQVADTGIGMSAEQIGRLFNPFQQADGSTSRRFGGTGLGLAISKRLAELMGGDIRVDSVEGAGSTFEFILPLLPA